MRVVMLTCVLGFAACVSSSSSEDKLSGGGGGTTAAGDPDDVSQEVCEVETPDVGVVGELATHGTTLKALSWVPKSGTKDQFVGFTLSRKARFTVHAGTYHWKAEGTEWTSPKGVTGPAVTSIDFCDDYCEDKGTTPPTTPPTTPTPTPDPLPPVD